MNPTIYRYPLDPTGTSVNNLVVDEEHQLSNRTVRCIAPTYGGFYAEGAILRDAATDIALIKGQDYIFGELLEFPTGRYGKEIFGIVVIKKATVSKVKFTYQSLGGDYSYSMDAIVAMIENLDLGDRPVAWGDIVGRPPLFNPASHFHDIGDIYGFEYITHAIERLRSAVLLGDTASHDEIYRYIDTWGEQFDGVIDLLRSEFEAHRSNTGNPHGVTKAQVGLGSVQNYDLSTQVEAEAGTSSVKYMTPLRTAQAIAVQALIPLNTHTSRVDNPHSTTKAQVGLGSVEDYGVASQIEAEVGTSNVKYMTPLRTAQAVSKQALVPLNNHIARTDNPHSVTQAQVGLGSVDNYATASQVEAEAGTTGIRFMTPLRTAQAIAVQAIAPLNNHIARADNPHSTTKVQVGLGNVDNYLTANQAEAEAGALDVRFMTPLRTAQAIAKQAITPLNTHAARSDNPHSVTKTQVGLGNVQNYGIASNADAVAGTSNSAYMTPLRVKEAIFQFALTNTNFSTVVQGPSFWANTGMGGGYTFRGDGAADTGMFSTGDGQLQLMSNGATVFTTTSGGSLNMGRQIVGTASGMAMIQGNSTGIGSLMLVGTGGGDANMAGMTFYVGGGYDIRMGLRGDGFFGIGGASRPAWSWYTDPSGNSVSAGDVVAYSDPRLKENFQLIENPFELLDAVQGYSFDWKSGFAHTAVKAGMHDYGFNALDVHRAAPELVHGSICIDGETYLTVAYDKFAPFLARAAILLREKDSQHDLEIDKLKSQIAELKTAVGQLQQLHINP